MQTFFYPTLLFSSEHNGWENMFLYLLIEFNNADIIKAIVQIRTRNLFIIK